MMRSTFEYWRNWVASITMLTRPRAPILKMILMPPWQLHRTPVLPYSTSGKPLEAREHQNEFLLDFFAIRAVFTLYGLRVLWGIYLIDQALPFVTIFTNPNLSAAAAGPIIAIFLRAA